MWAAIFSTAPASRPTHNFTQERTSQSRSQRSAVVCRASSRDGGAGGDTAVGHAADSAASPWQLSNYYTKKLERRTDSVGNIISTPDTIAEAPGWTRDAQLRLAAETLANGLQQDAAVLLEQVERLHALLPGMDAALRRIKPADLVRMAAQVDQISQQLVALRMRFSSADVAAMVASHPQLLHMSAEQLEGAVAVVQQEFPDAGQADVEAMLSTNPSLLDGGATLRRCLDGVGHLLTRQQLMRSLQRDPTFLFQFQPLEGQSRGERDAEYLADMYKP